jgi:SAM-dependent methyltransferase
MSLSRLLRALRHRLLVFFQLAQHEAVRLRTRNRLIPPANLHQVGLGDFRRVGDNVFRMLVRLARLRPDERVLDIGCGTGRIARPLSAYLAGGRYDGLDIVSRPIAWCRGAYRRLPHFRFHHADLINRVYNPDGAAMAAQYRFAFEDESFDLVLLISVFTHMLTHETRHYLREIARLLAPGGRVFLTAFLLDDPARDAIRGRRTSFAFSHRQEGCYSERVEIPESAVAYDREVFAQMTAAAGLEVIHAAPGSWRGSEGASFQDVLILCAASPRGKT